MQQRDRDILEHIIRYCDRIAGYLDKIENSKARFLEDQMCQDACCMCIAQIGELSFHISLFPKALMTSSARSMSRLSRVEMCSRTNS